MAQGKQAKILNKQQQQAMLDYVSRLRHPARDRVTVLLSFLAGLRATEISRLTWSMVTDADGEISTAIELPNTASKGKTGGRTIAMHPDLVEALSALQQERGDLAIPHRGVVYSERGTSIRANGLAVWFGKHYRILGFEGASSHSGRRTFGTNAAKNVAQTDGSLRDVQQLLGHASLATTQKYVEGNSEAKRKIINLL